jgi:hypothetical protein
VSARTPIRQRIAAFVAMLALGLNLAALALVQAHAAPLDTFGQPICSEHANSAPGEQPGAPADAPFCQFCCMLTVAASADAPVLPMPAAAQWTQAGMSLIALQLPSPSHHLLAPPRGPPLA